MAEPTRPAELDVVLVCPPAFSPEDMAHLSAVVTMQGIRCFASTLSTAQGLPDPAIPWSSQQPTKASNQTKEQRRRDRNLLLDDLLTRILAENAARTLALVVVGDTNLSELRQHDRTRSPFLGDMDEPDHVSRVRRTAWIRNASGASAQDAENARDGFLITTVHRLTPAEVVDWLETEALPWVLGNAPGLDDKDESH